VWSGDAPNERAQGWASCEKEKVPECVARLEARAGAGKDGSVGLRFEAQGPEWLGFGWNWFSWWPEGAGTDISHYKSVVFWIRVVGEPGMTPEPFTVTVALGGSARGGQDQTASVKIADYAPGFADGEWQKVAIPLEPLLRGEGEKFDTTRAWSITIGAWNQGERNYTILVDEIGFS
jgi:hypothetical protein